VRRWPGAALALATGLLLAAACGTPAPFSVALDDSSMEPTFAAHTEVRFGPVGSIRRGAIVAFEYPFPYPGRPLRILIARVVGLPDERIELGPDRLLVDGLPIAEPYAKNRDRMATQTIVVPPGSYVVLGDDRANQRDSRWWGALPAAKLIGMRVEE
jgi:signal peptidase I